MRLYLIENTLLADIAPAPTAGDVVAFFRNAQDSDGTAADNLRKNGITVIEAEALLNRDEDIAIDDWVNNFIGAWWRTGPNPQDDFSQAGGLSLGFLGSYIIFTYMQPGMLVRAGEIMRRLLATHQGVGEILTDIRDGHYPVNAMKPEALPRRTLLAGLAAGIPIVDMNVRPLPTLMLQSRTRDGLIDILRIWLGGLRPKFLLHRLLFPFQNRIRPRIYFFLNHFLSKIAGEMGQCKSVTTFSDWQGIKGTEPFRYDHLLPIPSLDLLVCALGLWRKTKKHMANSDFSHFNGFDYAPFLGIGLKKYCGTPQIIAAIRASQTRRFLKILRPNVIVVNSDGTVSSRTIITLQPSFGYRVINIEHGLNSMPYGYWSVGSNHPNITVVVPGEAHMNMWGRFLPENKKPRRVVLATHVAAQMTPVRGRRRSSPGLKGGRVLILNFSPTWAQSNRRVKKMDRYTLDVLSAARTLIEQGVTVHLRPQLTFNTSYFKHMIKASGLDGKIAFNRTPDFAESLLDYDVVVTNLTTCYYQSLYAGWPTIFYEPDFDRRDFVGLLGDKDIAPPHAEKPDELVRLVTDVLQDTGPAASFPAIFNDQHLETFLGPSPENAESKLAAFLEKETVTSRADTKSSSPN